MLNRRPAVFELSEQRFVFGNLQTLLGIDFESMPEWTEFQQFWKTLELDKYMNDGGTYRFRRFGRFKYFAESDSLELQPYRPYSQPVYFNPLNGGIDRHFGPLTESMVVNAVTQAVLKGLGRAYSQIEDTPMWKINAYFNRIVASADQTGKPVPEGMHRDGVKFSCLLMADSSGFSGGDTTLYDIVEKKPIFEGRLAGPGATLLFRDDTVFHDTTAMVPVDNSSPGTRDVLVIEFY